jgi:hypothetical protein
MPMVASLDLADLFLIVERTTGLGSLVIANGAYSLAILMLTIALCKRPEVKLTTTMAGYGVAVCGFLLAGAGFTGVPEHALWFTGPTIGLFCSWTLLVARELEAARDSA